MTVDLWLLKISIEKQEAEGESWTVGYSGFMVAEDDCIKRGEADGESWTVGEDEGMKKRKVTVKAGSSETVDLGMS